MKQNYLYIIIAILALMIMYLAFFKKDDDKYDTLRREMVKSNTLLKVSEGNYKKLVDDYNTSSDLMDSLLKTNKDLHKDIEKSNDKVVSLTQVLFKLKDRAIHLEPGKDISEVLEKKDTLDFFYPDEVDPLITHSISFVSERSIYSMWKFNAIPLDLVVTETSSGVFETNLSTNPFLEVTSLKVNTVKLKPDTAPKERIFGWAYGAGVWKSPTSIGVDVYGGVRVKNTNILLRVQPSVDPQVGAMILFTPR